MELWPQLSFYLIGNEIVVALAVLLSFADGFVLIVPSFLRFVFAENLRASSEVDMSRSGS